MGPDGEGANSRATEASLARTKGKTVESTKLEYYYCYSMDTEVKKSSQPRGEVRRGMIESMRELGANR